jgi:hypothetical protein
LLVDLRAYQLLPPKTRLVAEESIFQALLVDALFVSPSGTFKNKASIGVYSHLQN